MSDHVPDTEAAMRLTVGELKANSVVYEEVKVLFFNVQLFSNLLNPDVPEALKRWEGFVEWVKLERIRVLVLSEVNQKENKPVQRLLDMLNEKYEKNKTQRGWTLCT